MEMSKVEGLVEYDPFVINENTTAESLHVRRRHAVEDAQRARDAAINKAFADEKAAIERIDAIFDEMARQLRKAAA